MTDAEREGKIRQRYHGLQGDMPPFGDVLTLLRLLDEARATGEVFLQSNGELTTEVLTLRSEVARLEHLLHGRSEAQLQENLNICVAQKYEALAEVERLEKALADIVAESVGRLTEIARLRASLTEEYKRLGIEIDLTNKLREELRQLRAPSEGDVIERADRAIAEHVAGNPDGTRWWTTGKFAETVAGLRASFIRALTTYGDQRVREVREELIAAHAEIARLKADMTRLRELDEESEQLSATQNGLIEAALAEAKREGAREVRVAAAQLLSILTIKPPKPEGGEGMSDLQAFALSEPNDDDRKRAKELWTALQGETSLGAITVADAAFVVSIASAAIHSARFKSTLAERERILALLREPSEEWLDKLRGAAQAAPWTATKTKGGDPMRAILSATAAKIGGEG